MEEEERVWPLPLPPRRGKEEGAFGRARSRGDGASTSPSSSSTTDNSDRSDAGGELRASAPSRTPQHLVRPGPPGGGHRRVARPAVDDDDKDGGVVFFFSIPTSTSISAPIPSLPCTLFAVASVVEGAPDSTGYVIFLVECRDDDRERADAIECFSFVSLFSSMEPPKHCFTSKTKTRKLKKKTQCFSLPRPSSSAAPPFLPPSRALLCPLAGDA